MDNKNKKIKVYLSAGWFDKFQEDALNYLENYLFSDSKYQVYSPRKEIKLEGKEGIEIQNHVFAENCRNIEEADIIVSSTVGKDMGTLWEDGYAFAKGKPIVYTFFDNRFGDVSFNLMLAASGIAAFTDKKEFEEFMSKMNKDNFKELKQRYEGDFE